MKHKVLGVSSVGGHFQELTAILSRMKLIDIEGSLILVNDPEYPKGSKFNVSSICKSGRDFRVIVHFLEAAYWIIRIKPRLLVSCGAGCAVPFFLVARLIGLSCVYVESISRMKSMSKTGALLYFLGVRIVVRWSGLKELYPKAELVESE